MRILVCGSRHFDDWALFVQEMDKIVPVNSRDQLDYDKLTIIEGGAKGADFLARVWAKYMMIPFEEYPADWEKHGKAAGPIRNRQMLPQSKPDLVVAFMGPASRGTADMVKIAQEAGVPVKVINIGDS